MHHVWHRYDSRSPYEKLVRPGAAVTPNVKDRVEVQLEIESVINIDSVNQDFEVRLVSRYVWRDWRLTYNGTEDGGCIDGSNWRVNYPGSAQDYLWTPGVTFANIEKAQRIRTAREAVWVLPSGLVWVEAVRLIYAQCSVDAAHMPYDTQTCYLELSSFRYWNNDECEIGFFGQLDPGVTGVVPAGHGDDLQYGKDSDAGGGGEVSGVSSGADPIAYRVARTVIYNRSNFVGQPLEFTITAAHGEVVDVIDAAGWTYRVARMYIDFTREPYYYEQYYVVPMYFIVVISWANFFVSRSAAPARVTLVLVCFLALVTKNVAIQDVAPKDSQDMYLLQVSFVSFCFVFYATLASVFAMYLMRVDKRCEQLTNLLT